MINITIEEARRFFCFILQKTIEYSTEFLTESSRWRRHHQYIAKIFHQKTHAGKYKYSLQL